MEMPEIAPQAISGIDIPILLIIGDSDIVTPEHAVNRRVQVVALTEAGEAAFGEMRCHSSAYWPIVLARTVTLAVIGVKIPGCDASQPAGR